MAWIPPSVNRLHDARLLRPLCRPDIELKRRESAKHLAASRKREREAEDEAKAAAAAAEAHDASWVQSERVEDRIDDWRDFQKTAKRVDSKNYKQQERTDSKKPKFGASDMESWRKHWK